MSATSVTWPLDHWWVIRVGNGDTRGYLMALPKGEGRSRRYETVTIHQENALRYPTADHARADILRLDPSAYHQRTARAVRVKRRDVRQ